MKTFTPKVITVFPKSVKARPQGSDSKKKTRKRRPKKMMVDVNNQEIKREWFVVDAKDQVLGRLASQIATILRGKHKTNFVPHMDVGDFVVVINASQIKFTGNKATDKMLYRHSGYPNGLRQDSFGNIRESDPSLMLLSVIKCMLPRNKVRHLIMRKLKVYGGADHPHTAQQPKPLELLKPKVYKEGGK